LSYLHALFDVHHLIQTGGLAVLCLIIFAETGFFALLPGDSLLVAAGVIAAAAPETLNLWLLLLLPALCAVAGDQLGFFIGQKVGPPLYRWKDKYFLGIPIFKKDYLVLTEKLYKNYGVSTIVLARFVPIARTFAPLLAGVGKMRYATFLSFNVVGGFLWVWSMVLVGYFLKPVLLSFFPTFDLEKNIEKVVLVVIFVSLLPGIYHIWAEKRKSARLAVAKKKKSRR
jgi:membrane-associated protein